MATRSMRTPGMRSTPGMRGAGIRTPKTQDPHARGRQVMKQARIATGNVGRAQQGIRSVGRGGVVTKSGTTAAAFRAGAPVDKTAAARFAAARAAGMTRPVGRQMGTAASALASLSGRTPKRKATQRVTSRGSSRRM